MATKKDGKRIAAATVYLLWGMVGNREKTNRDNESIVNAAVGHAGIIHSGGRSCV